MPRKNAGMWRNKNSSTRKKATPYRNTGVTEVGKEAKTQSYKEYVQKKFGGGMTKGMWAGGPTYPTTGGRPPSTPGVIGKIKKWRDRNPDPVLPRGKRDKQFKGPGV
jgi:hypothetical protein